MHTSTGRPVTAIRWTSADVSAELLNRYFGRTGRRAASDYQVDGDSIAISTNCLWRFAWAQGSPNPYSISIEMAIRSGNLDPRTVDNTVTLIDVLTAVLRIQRQTAVHDGRPDARLITRLRPGSGGGTNVTGIFGHRNVAWRGERGLWDPGERIFEALLAGGYEGFDYDGGQDLAVWRERQAALGVPVDGVPGLATARALEAQGRPCGIWVPRSYGCPAAAAEVLEELERLRAHVDAPTRRRPPSSEPGVPVPVSTPAPVWRPSPPDYRPAAVAALVLLAGALVARRGR